MRKPVLSIFADGLRYDSLKYMPFMQKLHSVPLRTVFGHSITCHPSMYTGVYPDKHKIVFHWIKSDKKFGPYTPLSIFPNIFPFSNPYIQAIVSHFYSKFFLKNNAFMGYGKVLNMPMKYWKSLETNEKKYWDEDNYINDEIKTIFELVRKNKLNYHVSNIHKPNLGKLDAIKIVEPSEYDWIYYFVGELDSISHKYTQHSKEGEEFLLKLDKFVEERYKEFEKEYSDFTFIFWSDHGHIPITKRYDLYTEFKNRGFSLNNIFHILDSTTLRIWTHDEKITKIVKDIMENIDGVNFLTDKDFLELHLPKDSNLYGDLMFDVDGGIIFTNTIHGFGSYTKSMHGYHPSEDGNLGSFVSNRSINVGMVNIPDVFASTITSLGLTQYLNNIDGHNQIS